MQVAKTILSQLGGKKFLAMTGAKHLLGNENTRMLQFHLPRFAGVNVRKVLVRLDADDTYTMEFYDSKARALKIVDGVYAEDLQRIFRDVTGLATHL